MPAIKVTGAVAWRKSKGMPEGWYVRVSTRTASGEKARPWVYLGAPHLENTPDDKARAQKLGAKFAAVAKDSVLERHSSPPPAEGATIAVLADLWLELVDVDPATKGATKHQHRSVMRAHVVKLLGAKRPADLDVPTLRAFFRGKAAEKSASTVRNISNTLTRFLADVKAEHWAALATNVMYDDEVRAVLPPVTSPDPEDIGHLTGPQVDALLASPAADEFSFGVELLEVVTGLREGEAFGLRFSDFDIEEGVFRARVVRQALMPRGEGRGVELGAVKSRFGKRAIPAHPLLAAWLVGWALSGWRAVVGRDPKPDDLLFADANGLAQRPRTAEKLRDHLGAAGLPKAFVTSDGEAVPFGAHSLRHTFATLLGESEVAGDVVDRLLGHAPATTRGRHYQAPKLSSLYRAISTLVLAVPPRLSGVSGTPVLASVPEWSRLRDLNSRPAVYETAALPLS
jgi:integrase